MEYQFAYQQNTSKRCLPPKYPFPRICDEVADKLLPENQTKHEVTPINSEVHKDIMQFNACLPGQPPYTNSLMQTLSITNLIREEVQNILRELNLTNGFLRKEEVDYIIEKCVAGKLAASQVNDLNSINLEKKRHIELTVQMLNNNDKSELTVENFQMLEQRITKLEKRIEILEMSSQCQGNNSNTISLSAENQEPSHKDVAVATESVTDVEKDINMDAKADANKADEVESVPPPSACKNSDNSTKDTNLIKSCENDKQQSKETQTENGLSDKPEHKITEFNYYDELYYVTRQRHKNQLNTNFGPFQMSKQPQIYPFTKPISISKPRGGLLKGQKAKFIS